MLKYKKIIIGAGLIFIIIGLTVFLDNINQPFLSQEEIGTTQENAEEVVLVIDGGEGKFEIFQSEYQKGMTAFDLLRNKSEELKITLKTKAYDVGIFIEAIGDKENGRDGKYWLYYINGGMPQVASDKQRLNPGDRVEFKFEKSSF